MFGDSIIGRWSGILDGADNDNCEDVFIIRRYCWGVLKPLKLLIGLKEPTIVPLNNIIAFCCALTKPD